MYQATVNDDGLKNGLAVSGAVHFVLFLFLYFGLPHLMPPLPSHHEPVPFEIVTLADLTNTRIKDEEQKPQPPAPPPKPEPEKPAPAPPQPPQPVAKPQPPAPKPPEPKPEEKAEALKPVVKPKPKPVEQPKPQQDLLASVLKDVSKMKPVAPVVAPDVKSEVKTPAPAVASPAPSLSTRLTISDEDALRRQIEQCWNPPIGARDAQSLVVEVVIDVNADKTVANADIVDKGRYNTDSFFRAAADAAVRAVRNPRCSPLILPEGKFDQWKRIDFTFDPRDML
ncbi:MAG: energy transducer TonB [Alphaproteobacteria bacterium]|nr:energy transducer TonB [Alphaproteobacteria bacterium]